jgi:hypothetical protein
MWSMIPAAVIVLAQATQPCTESKTGQWCFEREQQGAQLCEETEAACNKLRSINTEIARSPCKRVEPPEIQISPTAHPAPPNPEKQTPTQR